MAFKRALLNVLGPTTEKFVLKQKPVCKFFPNVKEQKLMVRNDEKSEN